MIRTGFVKEKKGDQLRVCFERPEACEGCRGCTKGFLPKKELLTVFGDAEVGDMVDVQMAEARTLKATLLAYALPLCLLLIGLLAGSAAGLSDGWTMAVSLLGLALGALAVWLIDRRLRRNEKWRPTVVRVVPAEQQAERK
ncbi:MAG: SoxR reducing system RseC family protein [Clostridia bacterium]|nr:SoxR reducing system RseC family protein [Clostridia bacterium]